MSLSVAILCLNPEHLGLLSVRILVHWGSSYTFHCVLFGVQLFYGLGVSACWTCDCVIPLTVSSMIFPMCRCRSEAVVRISLKGSREKEWQRLVSKWMFCISEWSFVEGKKGASALGKLSAVVWALNPTGCLPPPLCLHILLCLLPDNRCFNFNL